MDARFSTYAEAAQFAAERQSEGYFAKITQEGRMGQEDAYVVTVSNPNDELGDDEEPLSRPEQMAINIVRFVVVAILGIGAGWALLELIAFLFQGGIVPVLLIIAALTCAFFALAGWSKVLSSLVSKSREDARPTIYPYFIAFVGAVLVGVTLWFF